MTRGMARSRLCGGREQPRQSFTPLGLHMERIGTMTLATEDGTGRQVKILDRDLMGRRYKALGPDGRWAESDDLRTWYKPGTGAEVKMVLK